MLSAVALRSGVAVFGAVAALISMTPPVSPATTVPVVVGTFLWAAIFAWIATTRGAPIWLMVIDVAVSTSCCLCQKWLVAPDVLADGGASWVAILGSMTVIMAQLTLRPVLAVPAGLVATAGCVIGANLAGSNDHGVIQGIVYLVQIGSSAAFMVLLRRSSSIADAAMRDYYDNQRAATVDQARRTEERHQNRRLHDTVLATLTMVGTGAITTSSVILRTRAAADLVTITGLGEESRERDTARQALDDCLGRVVADADVPARVSLTPCTAPPMVAMAFELATAEALRNVRHSGAAAVELHLRTAADVITVVVIDHGRGFDVTAVPAHRYGIRESIQGRMRAAGGKAEIRSAPGEGTQVQLWWPSYD